MDLRGAPPSSPADAHRRRIAIALAARGFDVALAITTRDEGGQTAAAVREHGRRARPPRRPGAPPPAATSSRARPTRSAVSTPGGARLGSSAPLTTSSTGGLGAHLAVDWRRRSPAPRPPRPTCAPTRGRIVLFSDWVAASGRPRYRGLPAAITSPSAASLRSAKRWPSSSPATASSSTPSPRARSSPAAEVDATPKNRPSARDAAGPLGRRSRSRPVRRCSNPTSSPARRSAWMAAGTSLSWRHTGGERTRSTAAATLLRSCTAYAPARSRIAVSVARRGQRQVADVEGRGRLRRAAPAGARAESTGRGARGELPVSASTGTGMNSRRIAASSGSRCGSRTRRRRPAGPGGGARLRRGTRPPARSWCDTICVR